MAKNAKNGLEKQAIILSQFERIVRNEKYTYLFVECSDDCKPMQIAHNIINKPNSLIFDYSVQLISTTRDITEEQAKYIVEFEEFNEFEPYITPHYFDYTDTNKWEYTEDSGSVIYGFKTAKDSLQSLIQSLGLDVNKNYLILLKK